MKTKINIALSLLMIITFVNVYAVETKEIKVDEFNKLKLEGSAHWVLIPSDVHKVVIESKSGEMFNYVDVDEFNSRLTISTVEKTRDITKLFKSVVIKVYVKSIDEISLSGVGSVEMNGGFTSNRFEAILRGTGDMSLKLECDRFEGFVFGTGSLEVQGTTESLLVNVEGVGSYDGFDFISSKSEVTVSGVGSAEVYASNSITATINGVGSIRYKGDPENKDLESNGLGSIRRAK